MSFLVILIFYLFTISNNLYCVFQAGIPRTAYRGVVTFFYGGHRILLAPNNNWKGYDPTWS